MAQQIINVGAAPNDGTGDPDRAAWTKANANFTELYAAAWGNVSNVGTPSSGQFAQWTTATTIQGISAAATVTALGAAKDAFCATRNGANQAGFASNTFAKCLFTFENFDQNSKYDNITNYRWTPAAGLVELAAQVYLFGLSAGTSIVVGIFKNGAAWRQAYYAASQTSEACANIFVIDNANGTDYYECWAAPLGAATATLYGATTHSFFQGFQL